MKKLRLGCQKNPSKLQKAGTPPPHIPVGSAQSASLEPTQLRKSRQGQVLPFINYCRRQQILDKGQDPDPSCCHHHMGALVAKHSETSCSLLGKDHQEG